MTVYVDTMCAKVGLYVLCHMLADTEDELHEMAEAIGMRHHQFQGDHYDICQARRARAVKLGAVEITLRQAGAMHSRRRYTGGLGSPSDAVAWLRAHMARRRSAAQLDPNEVGALKCGGEVPANRMDEAAPN